ncbi:uncharacterized protein C18orf63-like [Glandiceps talaboti]
MDAKWKNPTALFFVRLPEMKELCAITLVIKRETTQDNGNNQCKTKSAHQLQVIKCRELIFTEPNIMATPSLDDCRKIYLTMHQHVWKAKTLLLKFQKMGLQVESAGRLLSNIFQACYIYTLTAKLAPHWNKVGNLMIQGRDFLMSNSKMNAVKMNVTVTSEEISFALEASTVKLPANQIEDFEVCTPVLEKFCMSRSAIINEFSIEDKWCHVLPSMKKGKLVNITHDIPQSSPFKTYKDIRRHWKNTYGYRLPETEEGLVYFNIYFPALGHSLFTYPELCVRKRDLLIIPRTDSEPILSSFLNDIKSKLPQVCGMPYNIDRKPQYSTPVICEASNEEKDLSNITLTDQPLIRKLPERRPIERLFPQASSQVKSKELTSVMSQSNMKSLFRNASFLKANCPPTTTRDEGCPNSTSQINISRPLTAQKLIPIFKPQCVKTPASSKPQLPKTVPVFKPTRRPVIAPVHKSQQNPRSHINSNPTSSQVTVLNRNITQQSANSLPYSLSQPANAIITPTGQTSMNGERSILQECHIGQSQINDLRPHKLQLSLSAKRKKQVNEGSDAVKKPRPKPKIQENVDIASLAIHGQLSKVNTATLVNWLKDRHIPLKAKDKKSDLIDKVMTHLQIQRMEE